MTKEQLQLLLSAISLVLTPILSALVVRHQLKRSHYWWIQQQDFLNLQKYADKKYEIYERAAKILPRLQSLLLEQQVFIFSRTECVYLLKYCKDSGSVDRELIRKEYERYVQLTVEQNAAIEELISEFQQIGFIARRFYFEDTIQPFQELFQKVKAARSPVLSLIEITTISNQNIGEGMPLEMARIQLGKEFDVRWEKLKPEYQTAKILDAMFLENFPKKQLSSTQPKGWFNSYGFKLRLPNTSRQRTD